MRDALNRLIPGVIFGGAGVALIWYVASSCLQWKRTGSMRVSVSLSWSPLGEWAPLARLFRSALSQRDEPAKSRELRSASAVISFLGVCVVVATVLLIVGYHYLRFGHGFGN
ncbi:hypothetical protein EFL26_11450 [Nocardioides pocheonensis]|uniref:Uncharacterized protein n=1 Tax=Nocardioides pocheonensis TaxID=661485 RepID=A0A3N0GMC5_9ACTN|nr:hypothetical protein EFL26_11450 [Nocardioides pocheonensis]